MVGGATPDRSMPAAPDKVPGGLTPAGDWCRQY